jgi:DNA processing protein
MTHGRPGEWVPGVAWGGPGPGWPPGFVSGPADRRALAVLLCLSSLTPRRLLEAAQTRRSARACLRAVRDTGVGREADRSRARDLDGAAILARLPSLGARLVAVGEAEYPVGLLDLFDPPAGLFVRGGPLGSFAPRVAIVGARNCSPMGREIAELLGSALARAGVCVVSGGARGIDSAAHRGALAEGGNSVAVLGCGIDIDYPRQNRCLFEQIVASGAVVSEYPPGVRAEPFRFPARNRIIAALSRAVVVVEGAEGSGSMISADHALDLGRDVFAVPGPVTGPLSWAPHALIREGATLIRGPDDLLTDLGLRAPDETSGPADGSPLRWLPPDGLTDAERKVWGALSASLPADTTALNAGLTLPETVSALVGLEMRGLVRQVGGRYERRPQGRGST